mgnify:CR=1 FL=1
MVSGEKVEKCISSCCLNFFDFKQTKGSRSELTRPRMLRSFIVALLTFAALANARCVQGSRTLVIYDERLSVLDNYSNLFNSMRERDYTLDFISVANETSSLQLFKGENKIYDNLMVFPIKGKTLNKHVSGKSLLQFSLAGGNVLAVSSPESLSDPVRLFLNQLGIYPSPKDYRLVDHFQKSSDGIRIGTDGLKNRFVYKPYDEEEDFFITNSSVAILDNREQLVPILVAPRTSYASGKGKDLWVSGSQGYLVVGFQALNNARTAWVGSPEFLSNSNHQSNGILAKELTKWTFKEKGVIKTNGFRHSHIDGTSYEEAPYKIKDAVNYEVSFSEWNGEEWQPFEATDIQFELKMLDPYYRLNLIPSHRDETYQWYTTGDFRLPDHHGVFTFQVDYKRAGLSLVSVSDVKAIRHLAHDEYPRSWEITNARVYISGIFAVIFAWVLFVIFFVSTSKTTKNFNTEKKNN